VFNRTAAAVTFDLDGAQVVAASSAPFYFDGDTAGCTWDGTRNASTSSTLVGVDGVNRLVRDLQVDLIKGAVVEYRPEGATLSTYFDLEAGEFRPSYAHPLYRHGYVPGVLELWTRPYGNTGTTQTVAASIAGTGFLTFLATGIGGDQIALGNAVINVGSYSVASQRAVGIGVYQHASYPAVHYAASQAPNAASFVLKGGSGALGSQYWAFELGNGINSPLDNIKLGGDLAGRHRVFGLFRSRVTPASSMLAKVANTSGATLTVVQLPTATQAWQLVDLGEVAGSDPTASPVATSVNLLSLRRVNGSAVGSFMVDYGGYVLLPVESGARVAVAPNAVNGGEPRAHWHFQSYPRTRTLAVASAAQDWPARGGDLRLAPTGTPVASGPHTVVAFAGDPTDFVANDILDVTLSVRERFTFFR
jgi:hypothetical protein